MTKSYRRTFSTVAVVLMVTLAWTALLTGCSSSETPDSNGATEVVSYKIGLGAPLTANAVAIGQGARRGVMLAIEQANASDEAKELGVKFELVDGDDQGDPKLGVNVANQFASDSALIGVVGHINSGVSIPASKVYNDSGLAMISAASTAPELTAQGFNNVFRTCTTDAVQGPAAAQAAYAEGHRVAVIIDDATAYGVGLGEKFGETFVELGGQVVSTERTNDKETDYTSLVTKVMASNADLIYFGGIYTPASYFIKQYKEAGGTGVVMGGDALYAGELVEVAGVDNAEGTLVTAIGYPVDQLPGGQKFVADYKAMFPNDEIASSFDAYAYDAALAMIDAAFKAAATVGADSLASPAGRTAIIENLAAGAFSGATGDFSFDDNGDTNNKAITVYRIEGGQFVPFLLPTDY